MATVIFRSPTAGVGMDFDNLQVYSAFFDYNFFAGDLNGNPDFLRLFDSASDYTEVTGRDFAATFDAFGDIQSVTGGVLDTFDVSVGGVLAVEATGINANLRTVYNALASNNTSVFLNTLLARNDVITGTAAVDVLDGFRGNDRIDGGNGNDTIRGGLGRDTLRGGNNNDSLSGGDNNDMLYGDSGTDTLNGGVGSDRFYGGTGNDALQSNLDGVLDTFYFGKNYDIDTITNFEEGIDTLAINDNIWGGGKTAAQVVADYATVNGAGTQITFAFGNGDTLIVKGTGLDLVSITGDITIF